MVKRIIRLALFLLASTLVLTPSLSFLIAGPGTTIGEPIYSVIHYLRDDGDYGDHTTGDYNDFWGLHLWGDIDEVIEWTSPKPFLGEAEYGRFGWVKLAPGARNVGFIVHRGDTKDGTDADRFFDPSVDPEIWLRNDDAAIYTSQAEAQGFVTIRYQRDDGDYGNPTSNDFNDYWGLHLWGDAIDASEVTPWTEPKKPSGIDDSGALWNILLADASQPVNLIIHRGDLKDPGPDQSFLPLEDATIWVKSGDETIYPHRGAVENIAILHYHRDDEDYGNPASGNFNDFWGLHTWTGALNPTPVWTDPDRPIVFNLFGAVFEIELVDGAGELAYILHRGDEKDPGPDQFLDIEAYGHEVWQLDGTDPERPYILPVLTTVRQAIGEIVTEVEDLIADGGLNRGQGKALLNKLDSVFKKLDQGNTASATDKLQAFIDQVDSFIAQGILATAEGQALIDAVSEIMAGING
jgi:hypothetical protein